MLQSLLIVIVIGAVVGVLARLVMPGRQGIGMLMTIIVGIIGALIGNYIGEAISPDGTMHWILAVVVSVVLLVAMGAFMGRRRA
ncbi:MAG TPA: GlsB/YeaQ/YmgE family stress response membrane protein [Actinomycetota bacterium]|nr:GlsB/YeaQ/YmgE family stress response membrane protein [Actinomycetota bacterium]